MTVRMVGPAFLLRDAELELEQIRMVDHHTDRFFARPTEQHTQVVFPVSWLLVDPERFLDDTAEPMSERGMGVLYTHTATGTLSRTSKPAIRPMETSRP